VRRLALYTALLLALVGAASTCALMEPEPNTLECRSDSDCFAQQGEYCDKTGQPKGTVGECRPRRDAGRRDLGPPREAFARERQSDHGSDTHLDLGGETKPRDYRGEAGRDKP
jgi:hypothetical protein